MSSTPYLLRVLLIAIFTVASVASAESPAKKPPVGIPADATLFNGKWYYVYLQKIGWKASKVKCERLGGQLAVIHDEATWAFIKTLKPGVQLWLGASDEQLEGNWVWVDGKPFTFKSWGRGQPDNARGEEHFLMMGWNGGNWNDAAESAESAGKFIQVQGFICEWRDK